MTQTEANQTGGMPLSQETRERFERFVVPTYGRFELEFTRGDGSYLFDAGGKSYLDMGAGIAVCCLGHAHPEIRQTLQEQSGRLLHISNLYYHRLQGQLAETLVNQIAPGKVFFANSGAEANEGLFKLARRFGHEEGRFEILTATDSFHGRTLAGIAATGQEKVKRGFEPMTPGFRQVPFNDLEAVRQAISPATVAVLIEGIQGEGGIKPATADYLIGLRRLCDENQLLLLMDEVQCGHYRTGRFQSYQRLLEEASGGESFLPDGVSMAKGLGGGFPIGAFWVREPYADLLGRGSHAATYGGNPLACAVALKVQEVIERDRLDRNARETGDKLKDRLQQLTDRYSRVIKTVHGLGLMLGLELVPGQEESDPPALRFVRRLHDAGLLTIPAGARIVRLLPPLNLSAPEANEAIQKIESVADELSS